MILKDSLRSATLFQGSQGGFAAPYPSPYRKLKCPSCPTCQVYSPI